MSNLDQSPTGQNAKDEKVEETRQELTEDEVELIVRMHKLIGNRWSLIAGRIPGRSAEEIEKYWTSKHCSQNKENP